jgi:outer membrane protein TolC
MASVEIQNAEQTILKADATERLRWTAMLPSVSADGSFSKSFRHSGDNKLWGFSLTPQITQTIYGSGARAAHRQARSLLCSAIFDNQNVMMAMRYTADYAYWNLSAMQLYMAATNEYVRIIKSLYDVVKERFNDGYAAKSDMLQVEARLLDAEFSQIAARDN